MKTVWFKASEDEFDFLKQRYGLENIELLFRPVIRAEMEKEKYDNKNRS